MKISLGTHLRNPDNIITDTGFGYATDRMLKSLARLGYEVKPNDPTADAMIWFSDPLAWVWPDGPRRIGYFPWESTELYPELMEPLNALDELWTPSPLIADWFTNAGLNVPIYVYEHGVDHEFWTPKKRVVSDTFNFLHLGAEALRKGGTQTMRAFRAAFPKGNDVTLTMKMINPGFNIPSIGNINIINRSMNDTELLELFHNSHAYVYPSQGEGFGLTPLQAMATAMPTITVPAWAPYARFLDPNLSLPATMGDSPYGKIQHPGQIFHIDFDDVVDRMRWVVDNYSEASVFAESMVPHIQKEYDWLRVTKATFDGLENRLEKASKPLALERSR